MIKTVEVDQKNTPRLVLRDEDTGAFLPGTGKALREIVEIWAGTQPGVRLVVRDQGRFVTSVVSV